MNEQLPPGMMFRSFLTVCSSLVLHGIALVAATFGIGCAFFPKFKETFDAGPEALSEAMQNNPGELIPPLMFWSVVGVTVLASLVIGWYVVRTAPFSQFPHAIFAAVLLFLYYLQMAMADPPGKKSMTLVYMIAFPLAILIGAKWSVSRGVGQYDPEDEAEMLTGDS